MATMDIKGEVEEKPYVQKIGAQIQILPDLVSPAPGFSDQVVGMKKDEEKEFDITFPEDYPNKEVAGKQAHFHVKLHEMKKEILPELNDEFAAQVSSDFKTVADLREEVEKTLSMREEERTRMEFEEKIIKTAIEQSTVEYPPVLVNMEINRILNEQARQLQMSGHAMEDYLRTINRSVEDLQEEMRPVATRNVTASLVLGKIAEAEKIEVNEEDINNGIDNMTRSAGEEKQEELRKMLDTPQTRDSLRLSLKTRKTIERLAEIAKNVVDSDKETKEEEKNEQPAIEQSTDE
jgi:trigger factor